MSELDERISLHPEQRKVLNLIDSNRGLIFSAPTSFGKTFIVFEYICRRQPQNVVMVVPTLALIDEYKQKIIRQYKNKFKNIEILYYLTSPSKKMLKDMGIYDGDIDQINAVIGEDFTSIAELQHLLKEHIANFV